MDANQMCADIQCELLRLRFINRALLRTLETSRDLEDITAGAILSEAMIDKILGLARDQEMKLMETAKG